MQQPAPRPLDGERRREPRTHADRLLHCLLFHGGGGPGVAASLIDVSRFGVGLIAARPVPAGSRVVVRLPGAGEARPATDLPALVIHGHSLSDDRHLVGAELSAPLAEEELQAILRRAASVRNAPVRRRRSAGGRPRGG